MPQEDPKWEICEAAEKIVAKLHELYPDKLGHFDPKAVGCTMIVNKEPPKSQSWDSKIKGIKEPEALYCSKQYVIMFFKKTWDTYNPAQRSGMLMRDLLRIGDDADGQGGKPEGETEDIGQKPGRHVVKPELRHDADQHRPVGKLQNVHQPVAD